MNTFLLGLATNGSFRFAQVFCDEEWHEEDKGYVIQRSYGQVHCKTTMSPKIIVNRTKQNRTWKEQVLLNYKSEVKKFLDKGYIRIENHPNEYTLKELQEKFGDIKTNQQGVIKPMLAKQFNKVTNTKIFNKVWIASRKLDGVRALFYFKDGEIHTASRGGTNYDYSTGHLRTDKRLLEFFNSYPNIILDGELFKRFTSLQNISGAARMEKNAYDNEWLEYWIYDCYDLNDPSKPAEQRISFLINELRDNFNIPVYYDNDEDAKIRILNQVKIKGFDAMKKLHDKYVEEGFEGLVIRDPDKPYVPGGRNNNMIKIKQYLDATYKIIGYELGLRGSEDMVFICEMEDGRTFKASPIGDRATKQEYVDNFDKKYYNHLGDCKYFSLSDTGIPTQPKFIYFRFDLE